MVHVHQAGQQVGDRAVQVAGALGLGQRRARRRHGRPKRAQRVRQRSRSRFVAEQRPQPGLAFPVVGARDPAHLRVVHQRGLGFVERHPLGAIQPEPGQQVGGRGDQQVGERVPGQSEQPADGDAVGVEHVLAQGDAGRAAVALDLAVVAVQGEPGDPSRTQQLSGEVAHLGQQVPHQQVGFALPAHPQMGFRVAVAEEEPASRQAGVLRHVDQVRQVLGQQRRQLFVGRVELGEQPVVARQPDPVVDADPPGRC